MVGRDSGTAARIAADLSLMKKHVRAFANRENLSQLRIVDPVQLLEGINMTGHPDPVHPPEELYVRLAACLMDRLASSIGRSSSKSCAEPFPKRIKLVSAGSTSSGNRGRGWQANRGGRSGGRGAHWGGRRGRMSF